jgi:protein-disulfide isomerase
MRLPVFLVLTLVSGLASAGQIDRAKSFGNPSAPLTIELFSDFQCPSCRALHMQELPLIMKDFVNPGKAYLVYKEFPLSQHAHSKEAATLACASARVGKYEQVADALFQNQPSWETSGRVFETVASVLTPAERTKVQALAKDPAVIKEVEDDLQEGQFERVNQTPTMIIIRNGKKYPIGGALNYDLLKRFLDELITK